MGRECKARPRLTSFPALTDSQQRRQIARSIQGDKTPADTTHGAVLGNVVVVAQHAKRESHGGEDGHGEDGAVACAIIVGAVLQKGSAHDHASRTAQYAP